MNYLNHNLITNLQEWKSRLYVSTDTQFDHHLKFLLSNLEKNKQLNGIIEEACQKYPFEKTNLDSTIRDIEHGKEIDYIDNVHQAAFCFQFIKAFIEQLKNHKLLDYEVFQQGKTSLESQKLLIENYISPIVYYLQDTLDKSSSVLYLLEKYKKRTEWFNKQKLFAIYQDNTKKSEQILEDDLRLFLFDQGIDYPFSTPLSASGRADIIGNIDTNDPIVIEIKIFDKQRNYGKNRIKDGFNQIIEYCNNYSKDVGYLVIFNMDICKLNFKFNEDTLSFPPRIIFNNKIYYFIVIDTAINNSASTLGTVKEVIITADELTTK